MHARNKDGAVGTRHKLQLAERIVTCSLGAVTNLDWKAILVQQTHAQIPINGIIIHSCTMTRDDETYVRKIRES